MASEPYEGLLPMRISIIMLALDAPQYIDQAIASINYEGSVEIEHIVVHDGDDSFLGTFRRRYPAITVLKGDGKGATDAARLAVEAATGDFVLLLHCDDFLGPDAIKTLTVRAAERPDVKIWSGYARVFRSLAGDRRETVRWLVDRESTRLSIENVCDDIPLLTARFCHRSVFAELGNFDPDFPESSDREFLLRAVLARVVEAPLGVLVSEMRFHDASKTINLRQGWLPPYLQEHVNLAAALLRRPDLSERTREFLKNWRARELLRLSIYQFRGSQRKAAFRTLLVAQMSDVFWILRIITAYQAFRRRARNDPPPNPRLENSHG